MRAALLGVRLALSGASRLRSGLTVLASLLGATLLLLTAAIGRAELATADAYQQELPRLVLAVVLAIALPCGLLIATVARLSASLRDRRLANLRLIGLSPARTRLVAATEAGSAALVGTVLAWPAYWLCRAAAHDRDIAGRTWPDHALHATARDQLLVLVLLPALAVAVAVLPQRNSAAAALARMRRAEKTPPGLWRAIPLLLGVAMCCAVIARGHQREISDTTLVLLFAGIGVTGLGLVLVVPVFVRLAAQAMVRLGRSPATRLAARRLQAQPAAVTRVVSALLLGLFLTTGARYVVVAFESTPQYLRAAESLEQNQRVLVDAGHRSGVDAAERRLRTVPGVRAVVDVPTLSTPCTARGGCFQAIVLSCERLHRLAPVLSGCRDDEPMWVSHEMPDLLRDPAYFPRFAEVDTLDWHLRGGRSPVALSTPVRMPTLDAPGNDRYAEDILNPVRADVIIPPAMVATAADRLRHQLVVVGPPGRDLADTLASEGFAVLSMADYADYDFVAGLRLLTWSVAGVVLGVGLFTFGVAAIDRTVSRRREMVALQLVGVPARVIRRAQWWEALVPVGLGSTLGIGLGAMAGATYLTLDASMGLPWQATWTLAGVALAAAVTVSGLTVVASAPRIRAELIRAE